ncbi:CXXC-20-CXXC protein [Texcoconibacillus texcoconensis]|uniref:CXXC-20-CXXC protein n=2 Tax=Texcoconibacillus texcoconensis TaxID=1095777 RepID=A0A840QIN3_9BACI|nr:CXXC-20-CXXC protein [Texcoconibacillus texcoconensis]
MQKCDKCNTPFSWGSMIKSFFCSYKPTHCDHCETKHEITISGRFTLVSLTILPLLIVGLFLTPFNSSFINIFVGFSILIVGFLLAPYFVKYKAK